MKLQKKREQMSYLPPSFPKRPLPSGMYARPKQGGLAFFYLNHLLEMHKFSLFPS